MQSSPLGLRPAGFRVRVGNSSTSRKFRPRRRRVRVFRDAGRPALYSGVGCGPHWNIRQSQRFGSQPATPAVLHFCQLPAGSGRRAFCAHVGTWYFSASSKRGSSPLLVRMSPLAGPASLPVLPGGGPTGWRAFCISFIIVLHGDTSTTAEAQKSLPEQRPLRRRRPASLQRVCASSSPQSGAS